jgi:pimeloyl-ACP methyl ester carboxylesterase
VARELAALSGQGVLEPLQTVSSIAGQVNELRALLAEHGRPPLTLIGHSWGAWLALIAAAHHPELVRKLILVGSGPFEERDAEGIMATRLGRLDELERQEVQTLVPALADPSVPDRDSLLARLGVLISKTDTFDPLPPDVVDPAPEPDEVQADLHAAVWAEAAALRRSGGLLKIIESIRCPIVVLHGDYDPHPADGVSRPLAQLHPDFRFFLLNDCGHEPWRERRARYHFFETLLKELR